MSYLGDYAEDYADLNFKFTTRRFSTGAPHALSGGTISVYKSNDTTQSTAGVTLTADFDGVTGLNNVKIDLSADAFYATGKDYQVIITAGTVDSVSVVGECVASFSIENRFQEVDVVKWLGTAAATPTTAGVPEVDITHIAGAAVNTSSAQLGVNVVNAAGTAWGSGAITAGSIATDAIDADALATDFVTEIQSGLATAAELAKVPKSDSNVSWNATALAAIQSEANDALVAYDPPTKTEMDTAFTEIKGATWDSGTDTLEHIRNKETDIETDTQDLQGRVPAALISGRMDSNMQAAANGVITAAVIATDAIDADAIAADVTTELQNGLATAAELAKVPKSDGTSSWNATALAAIQSECADAIAATDSIAAASVSAAAANKIADHVLRRNTSNVEASSNGDTLAFKSVYGGSAMLTHEKDASSGTNIEVKKADGATTLATIPIDTDAAAEPIVGTGSA